MADLPLEFGQLEKHGCFVGSHAVVVMSDRDDIKAAALNLMRFFEDESCGQCTPCRVGTEKAVELMAQAEWDEPLLVELGQAMTDASICGLDRRGESAKFGVQILPRGTGMSEAVRFSLDGVEVEAPVGRDDLAGVETLRHPDPPPVPRRRAWLSRRRQLPRVHGGDRGGAGARRIVHPNPRRRA